MEWGYVDFLREVGRHFSMDKMLTAEGFGSISTGTRA